MNFVAIDFETANANIGSICQVGICVFEDGKEVDGFLSYVDPVEEFDALNIAIHGIDQDVVAGAPRFPEIYGVVQRYCRDRIVVSHTSFDRASLSRAVDNNGLPACDYKWLDSARVARRTWREFTNTGYGLSSLAQHFGLTFEHHNALADARTAGLILIKALTHSGMDVEGWLTRATQRVSPRSSPVSLEGSSDGPLAGEECVFTGALEMPRAQAAMLVNSLGAAVGAGVTARTTMLIVGGALYADGTVKTSKQIKAEKFIRQGNQIRIISESDFAVLAGLLNH